MRGKASGKVSGTGELSSPPSSSNASKKRNIVLPPHKLSACVLIMLRPAHPDTVKKMRIMSQTDQWNGSKHFVIICPMVSFASVGVGPATTMLYAAATSVTLHWKKFIRAHL